jgi:hypothetical protein
MNEAYYKIIEFKASELPAPYLPMIYSKFLRELRDNNELFKIIDKDSYFKNYHRYIETLLLRPLARIKLAVLSDDIDIVLGWALIEPRTVHFVYVNKDVRRIGIARSLLSEEFDIFSHVTNISLELWPSKFPKAVFNPFI